MTYAANHPVSPVAISGPASGHRNSFNSNRSVSTTSSGRGVMTKTSWVVDALRALSLNPVGVRGPRRSSRLAVAARVTAIRPGMTAETSASAAIRSRIGSRPEITLCSRLTPLIRCRPLTRPRRLPGPISAGGAGPGRTSARLRRRSSRRWREMTLPPGKGRSGREGRSRHG